MTLTGEQFDRLHSALVRAFPEPVDLELLIRVELAARLPANGSASARELAFRIIEWAERHDRLRDLLLAAIKRAQESWELAGVATELLYEVSPVLPSGDAELALPPEWLTSRTVGIRIDHLRVRNFRGFSEREFSFQPQFNVLIGDNATGKTAVLEALAVAAGGWLLGIEGTGTRTIRDQDIRRVGMRHGDETTFERQIPVEVAATGRVAELKLEWSHRVNSLSGGMAHAGLEAIRAQATYSDRAVRQGIPLVLPLVAYYGSGRLWLAAEASVGDTQNLEQNELSRLEGYRGSLDDRISPKELTRWLRRQAEIAFQESRDPDLYRLVRDVMRRMLEGAREVWYDSRRLEVVVEFEDGSIRPFGQLSDGQRNILALAGDMAMRMARLNPQLGTEAAQETPGIVLIDELDLHLHPTWQRHIVEDLRATFPKIQFFATTHSPFVVQTLRDGELLPLDAQPVPQVDNLGIEEIAQGLMGVERPEVSPRYQEMVGAAKHYLQTLDEAASAPEEKLEEYRSRLAEQIAPYADNPAFQAFLEMKRVARLGE